MRKAKGATLTEVQTTVDAKTGEILDAQENVHYPVGEEPPYYKVYMKDLSKIFGLAPAEEKVWTALCSNMSFTNRVVLIKPIKELLMKATGLQYQTVKQAIHNLTAKKLLYREDRSVYIVNPVCAARGEWKDIAALRLVIEYTDKGKAIELVKVNQHEIEIKEKPMEAQLSLFSDDEYEDVTNK